MKHNYNMKNRIPSLDEHINEAESKHYLKANDTLIATEDISVFVEKSYMQSIPADERERESWKGCYFTIKKGNEFSYLRSNDYDKSYFKLSNGATFLIEVGRPESWVERNNIKIKK